jgi:hypothetical protein
MLYRHKNDEFFVSLATLRGIYFLSSRVKMMESIGE